MLAYTQNHIDASRNPNRYVRGYIECDPNVVVDNIIDSTDYLISFTVHQSIMADERMCTGSCVSSYVEAEWYNTDQLNGVLLQGLRITPYIMTSAPGITDVAINMGDFYITDVTKGAATTKVTAYDGLSKLNVPYVPTVTPTSSGYKTQDIINDILTQTGAAGTVSGYTARYVQELYSGTCREVLGWIGSYHWANGGNWVINRATGALGWRSPSGQGSLYNSYPAITDDIIYEGGFGAASEDFAPTSYTTGTTDNVIVAGNGVGIVEMNPWMTQTRANTVQSAINGFSYTPMSLHFRGDPCIDPGDVLKVTTGGKDYKLYVMQITTNFNGGMDSTIECWGDSEAYYELSTSPTEVQITRTNNMLAEMAAKIETGDQGVITKIYDANGAWTELTIADNPDLQSATSVWRWNLQGLAHSTSYSGGTYTFALDDQGRIIASVIQTGILTDAQGKNSWNLDTGALTITEGSINITTSTQTSDQIILQNGVANSYFTSMKMSPSATLSTFQQWLNGSLAVTSTAKLGGGSFTATQVNNSASTSGIFSSTRGYLTYENAAGTLYASAEMSVLGGSPAIELRYGTSSPARLRAKIDYANGITFNDSSGTQTAVYPADATTLLVDNGLRLQYLADTAWDTVNTSGTTKTYTIQAGIYLLCTARYASSSTTQDGLWIVSGYPSGTSHLTPILAPTGGTTASVSGGTLSVTTGSNYVRIGLFRIT